MRVAYYSPMPPEPQRGGRLQRPAVPALERVLDVDVMRPGRRRRGTLSTCGSSTSATAPRRTGGSSTRSAAQRGLVVLHELVVHHLVAGVTLGARRRGRLPRCDAARGGVVGRLLAHGVIDGLIPPLWERRAVDFPLVARRWPTRTASSSIPVRRERGVRAAGYGGRDVPIPIPRGLHPPSSRGASVRAGGRPLRRSWPPQPAEAHRTGAGSVCALRPPFPEPGSSSPAASPASTSSARSATAGCGLRRHPRLRRRGDALAAPRRPPTPASTSASRRWARRPGSRCARCRRARRSSYRTSAGSPSCPTPSRSRSRSAKARSTRSRRRSAARPRPGHRD